VRIHGRSLRIVPWPCLLADDGSASIHRSDSGVGLAASAESAS